MIFDKDILPFPWLERKCKMQEWHDYFASVLLFFQLFLAGLFSKSLGLARWFDALSANADGLEKESIKVQLLVEVFLLIFLLFLFTLETVWGASSFKNVLKRLGFGLLFFLAAAILSVTLPGLASLIGFLGLCACVIIAVLSLFPKPEEPSTEKEQPNLE